jgi:hypothetical protein
MSHFALAPYALPRSSLATFIWTVSDRSTSALSSHYTESSLATIAQYKDFLERKAWARTLL